MRGEAGGEGWNDEKPVSPLGSNSTKEKMRFNMRDVNIGRKAARSELKM
jgi:hypothetical protein